MCDEAICSMCIDLLCKVLTARLKEETYNNNKKKKKRIRARIYNESAPDNVPERLDKKENVRDILKTDDSHTEMRLWEVKRLLVRKIGKKKRRVYMG